MAAAMRLLALLCLLLTTRGEAKGPELTVDAYGDTQTAAAVDRTFCLGQWNGGSWVHDPSISQPYARPLKPKTELERNQMCTAEKDKSWQYTWQQGPDVDERCKLVRPTPHQLCKALANKRLLLIGDSLTMQMVVSLTKLSGTGEEEVDDNLLNTGCAHLTCDTDDKGTQASFTLCKLYAAKMLVEPFPRQEFLGGVCKLPPERKSFFQFVSAEELREYVDAADYVIINEFAWWVGHMHKDLRTCLGARMSAGDASEMAFSAITELYRNQTWTKTAVMEGTQTPVYYRTATPGRPERSQVHGPMDLKAVKAKLFAYGHEHYARYNDIAREAYTARGLNMLELEELMVPRVDGHPKGDAIHYCLPGPPDTFAYVLYSFILPRDSAGNPV
ncbi:GDSL/SGNH-like acyl-esterase family found in Pmr5 and Cas1p-domain-containing protein [Tribonema minus]|uniref:GDSL/SGNH-like acyl-esterase family found in Pmr5 and Cas1p-domain-containing protein n=1 Tax=Tribonema minus TaxID=303371 RepID=A0A835ZAD9_9STRA|nr:GDSL/SGNH-like acyl-esterase family found in Pmr5 and Cas1p-domain-containing protein [Tribonema minus]